MPNQPAAYTYTAKVKLSQSVSGVDVMSNSKSLTAYKVTDILVTGASLIPVSNPEIYAVSYDPCLDTNTDDDYVIMTAVTIPAVNASDVTLQWSAGEEMNPSNSLQRRIKRDLASLTEVSITGPEQLSCPVHKIAVIKVSFQNTPYILVPGQSITKTTTIEPSAISSYVTYVSSESLPAAQATAIITGVTGSPASFSIDGKKIGAISVQAIVAGQVFSTSNIFVVGIDIEMDGLPEKPETQTNPITLNEEDPGAILYCNSVAKQVKMTLLPANVPLGTIKLTVSDMSRINYDGITTQPTNGECSWTITQGVTFPETQAVKGILPSSTLGDCMITLSYAGGDATISDIVKVTVVKVNITIPDVDEDKEENPGAFMWVNRGFHESNKDIDGVTVTDNIPDTYDPPGDDAPKGDHILINDPELVSAVISIEPPSISGKWLLSIPGNIKVWRNETTPILNSIEYDDNNLNVYLEGISAGSDLLKISYTPDCSKSINEDKILVTVSSIDITMDDTTEANEETEGRIIGFNGDDDDGSPGLDYNQVTATSIDDDDLIHALLTFDSPPQTGIIEVLVSNSNKIKLWTNKKKLGKILISNLTWDLDNDEIPPKTLDIYIEGIQGSTSLNDCAIRINYKRDINDVNPINDFVKITVVQAKMIVKQKLNDTSFKNVDSTINQDVAYILVNDDDDENNKDKFGKSLADNSPYVIGSGGIVLSDDDLVNATLSITPPSVVGKWCINNPYFVNIWDINKLSNEIGNNNLSTTMTLPLNLDLKFEGIESGNGDIITSFVTDKGQVIKTNVKIKTIKRPRAKVISPVENQLYYTHSNIQLAADLINPDGLEVNAINFYKSQNINDDPDEMYSYKDSNNSIRWRSDEWTNVLSGPNLSEAIGGEEAYAIDAIPEFKMPYSQTFELGDNLMDADDVVQVIVHNPPSYIKIIDPVNNGKINQEPSIGNPVIINITAEAYDMNTKGSIKYVRYFSRYLNNDVELFPVCYSPIAGTNKYNIQVPFSSGGWRSIYAVATDDEYDTTRSELIWFQIGSSNKINGIDPALTIKSTSSNIATVSNLTNLINKTVTTTTKLMQNVGSLLSESEATIPAITIIDPPDGTTYQSPASINMTAQVNIPVEKVIFEESQSGWTFESTTQPYTAHWSNIMAGIYTIQCIALYKDEQGDDQSIESDPITVIVDNPTPEVNLQSPLEGTIIHQPGEVQIIAAPTDLNGTIASVDFYVDGVNIESVSNAPYECTWSAIPGNHIIEVEVKDNEGAFGSQKSNVVVSDGLLITADIISPQPDAVISAGASTAINVDTGTNPIQKCEFYVDGTKINEDNQAPYSYNWTAVPGNHIINAVIFVDANTKQFLNPVKITVYKYQLIPTVSITNNLITPNINQEIPISLNIAGDVNKISKVELFFDDQCDSSYTTLQFPLTVNKSFDSAGTHTIYWVVTDINGDKTKSNELQLQASDESFPVVTIISPETDTQYTTPTNILLSASASSSSSLITSVKFYLDGQELESQTVNPYNVIYTSKVGEHTIRACAIDANGKKTFSTSVHITVTNDLPYVSIISPDDNYIYASPQEVTINAIANDVNGTIAKVEFSCEGKLISQSITAPYKSNIFLDPGQHLISAVSIDNDGERSEPDFIRVSVLPVGSNTTIAITSPYNMESFCENSIVTLRSVLTNGVIDCVKYYSGETFIGEATTSPYIYNWIVNKPGDYTISSYAYNGTERVAISAPVTIDITYQAVTVDIDLPESISIHENDNLNIPLNISENDEDLTGLTLLVDNKEISSISSAPYSFTWNNIPAGIYAVYVKATDHHGNITISNKIKVSVLCSQLPDVNIITPMNWKEFITPSSIDVSVDASVVDGEIVKVQLYDGDNLLGEVLNEPYNLSITTLHSGMHQLVAKAYDSNGRCGTSYSVYVVMQNPVPNVDISLYGNTRDIQYGNEVSLTINTQDTNGTVVKIEILVDDCKVIETQSANMIYSFTPSAGVHSIRALAYDNEGDIGESDEIMITVNDNDAPSANIISPADYQVVSSNTPVTITANAIAIEGTISEVIITVDGIEIGRCITAPYTITVPSLSKGSHLVRAVVKDSNSHVSTSSPNRIIVQNTLPEISIANPIVGAIYSVGENIIITAIASDANGNVTKVEFYSNGILIGEKQNAPYQISWQAPDISGLVNLSTIAYDNDGDQNISNPVEMNITSITSDNSISITSKINLDITNNIKQSITDFNNNNMQVALLTSNQTSIKIIDKMHQDRISINNTLDLVDETSFDIKVTSIYKLDYVRYRKRDKSSSQWRRQYYCLSSNLPSGNYEHFISFILPKYSNSVTLGDFKPEIYDIEIKLGNELKKCTINLYPDHSLEYNGPTYKVDKTLEIVNRFIGKSLKKVADITRRPIDMSLSYVFENSMYEMKANPIARKNISKGYFSVDGEFDIPVGFGGGKVPAGPLGELAYGFGVNVNPSIDVGKKFNGFYVNTWSWFGGVDVRLNISYGCMLKPTKYNNIVSGNSFFGEITKTGRKKQNNAGIYTKCSTSNSFGIGASVNTSGGIGFDDINLKGGDMKAFIGPISINLSLSMGRTGEVTDIKQKKIGKKGSWFDLSSLKSTINNILKLNITIPITSEYKVKEHISF